MNPQELKTLFEESLSETSIDAHFTFKPMFGGILAYCDGKALASLSNVGLAVKLAPAKQEELLALGGERLRYEPSAPPSKQYIVLPPAILNDRAALAGWIEAGVAFVRALPRTK